MFWAALELEAGENRATRGVAESPTNLPQGWDLHLCLVTGLQGLLSEVTASWKFDVPELHLSRRALSVSSDTSFTVIFTCSPLDWEDPSLICRVL